MSSDVLTNDSDWLGDILARLGQVVEAKRDADLARALKTGSSSLPTWRKRGTIPYANLVAFARDEGVSLNWLLLGVGPKKLPESGVHSVREPRAPGYGEKTEQLREVTERVRVVAEKFNFDPMKLGPLRDVAFEARLTDRQIWRLLDMVRRFGPGEFDLDLISHGLQLAFKYIEVGQAQEIDEDLKVEFIVHVLQRLMDEEQKPPTDQASTEERSADVIQFLEYLKSKAG
ncbi:MAG: helix-turn-helix domain-containing protein [Pseudomonadota bacterium]|nr:helix-turn-helix domain-containing protein [Pseudomonadota bacterium]